MLLLQLCVLQNATSRSMPSAGLPHSLAISLTSRVRKVWPPPQEAEHGAQAVQFAQAPSLHSLLSHDCVLQGLISSMSSAGQVLPPPTGALGTSRTRTLFPPPQCFEQSPHSFQLPHSQSLTSQGLTSSHCRVSPRLVSQPWPARLRSESTSRTRCWKLAPQVAEQAVQFDHSETWQLCGVQLIVLQPWVWIRSAGQSLPPCSGKTWISRCRRVCPPPQRRSHESQLVHFENTQSTFSGLHASVSCRLSSHGLPPASAGCEILRSRYF
mmetsp:Transcript_78633/g.202524  ORF Transcript_78633/g.202524 Transcript_78633/m.202524 type:complete len:268 (-) Transcript_78633:2844-3647(-)